MDVLSVDRLVAYHVKMGATGLMLAGTCGEGPWLTDAEREKIVRTTIKPAAGRLRLAMQVTDNSAVRTLANIAQAAATRWAGAYGGFC